MSLDLFTAAQYVAAFVVWLCAILYLMNAFCTLSIPYVLFHRAIKHPEQRGGISTTLIIDIVVLPVAVAAAAIAGDISPLSPGKLFLLGIALTTACYAHIFIAGTLIGLTLKLLGRFPDESPTK